LQPARQHDPEHRQQQRRAQHNCGDDPPRLAPQPPLVGGNDRPVASSVACQKLGVVSGLPDRGDQIGGPRQPGDPLDRRFLARQVDLGPGDSGYAL